MAENCFTDIPLEDVALCPNEEVQAGLSPEAFFIPRAFLNQESIMLPSKPFSELITAATVSDDIIPKPGEGFIKINLQVDLNSVSTALVGNRGNKKDQTTLNIFIPGTRAEVLGFKKLYKNVPGIFLVKDYNGKTFMVGTYLAPAYIDNLEVTTGQGNEDNNGGTGTIISNSNLYEYTGEIILKGQKIIPKPERIEIEEDEGMEFADGKLKIIRELPSPIRLNISVSPEEASQDLLFYLSSPDGAVSPEIYQSKGLVFLDGKIQEFNNKEYPLTMVSAVNPKVWTTIFIEFNF